MISPHRSRKHLAFVRGQRCAFCPTPAAEAHHAFRLAGGGGLGLKGCDLFTVPLCRGHHRELHKTGEVKPYTAGETAANEACATECAAHEATKAERDLMQSQKAALARRVLELEAQLKDYDDWANEPGALARWRADRAALSSVRELLAEELEGYPDCPRRDVLEAWLRAHPEPATPADPTRVYGGEGMPDVVLEAEPATPAATGEERQPLHRRRIGAAELQQRAEKEQKT